MSKALAMSRVFMAYSRRDGAYASQLYRALTSLNVEGFLDAADVAAGAVWDEAIKRAVRDADAVVVLLSENSLRSNFVMAEVGLAWDANKRIIPVIPPDATIEMNELPEILRDIAILDARNQTPAETADQIALAVAKAQQGA